MKGNLEKEQQSYYISPLGQLAVFTLANCVTEIHWLDKRHELPVLDDANIIDWLDGYFNGECGAKIPFVLKPEGTLFQQRVWYTMAQIPLGQTQTYGDIAKQLKSSAQAVGNACRANPIVVAIPCHRVVSANGDGGYAGQTQGVMMQRKLGLLALEIGVDASKIRIEQPYT